MALTFPNASRRYDTSRGAVSFVGHDGLVEVQFFVVAKALAKATAAGRGAESELACLSAFDAALMSIHAAARKAYALSRLPFHVLTAKDFS